MAASGTCEDPQGYGQAVAEDLFPDVLPYVVGTPATYGFAGRNGRTQADNAPEAMLCLVTNTLAGRRKSGAQARACPGGHRRHGRLYGRSVAPGRWPHSPVGKTARPR